MMTIFSILTISLSLICWVVTIILLFKSSKYQKEENIEKLLKEQIRHNKLNEENFYNLNKFLREKSND